MSNRVPSIQKQCSQEGCEKPHYAHGLCAMHYERVRRHGDVNAGPETRRKYAPGALCSVPGCERPRKTKTFCQMHYLRYLNTGDAGSPEPAPLGWGRLRGRPQSAEHIAKRTAAARHTLAASTRECKECAAGFTPESGGQAYCSTRCYDKVARRKRAKHEKSRRVKIPPALRAALLGEHDGSCWICGRSDRPLAIDHCHITLTIRGMLCTGCNRALGGFRDDPEILRAAIAYLEAHDPASAPSLSP